MLTELRIAVRTLLRLRAFTATTVLAFALGVGGSTLVFSVLDTLILRPLPFDQPETLVVVDPPIPEQLIYESLTRSTGLTGIAAYRERAANFSFEAETERAMVARVSERLLETLRVTPVLGRAFLAEEYEPGNGGVILLSHVFWQRRFGGSPAVIGSSVTLEDRPFTVVGILPSWFRTLNELQSADAASSDRRVAGLVPMARGRLFEQSRYNTTDGASRGLTVVARLRDGVSFERARSEAAVLVSGVWSNRNLPAESRVDFALVRATDLVSRELSGSVTLLMLGVGLLLLAACANVTNLLLERGEHRRLEVAICRALGAPVRALVWSSLIEVALLAGTGSLVGVALAGAGIQLAQATTGGLLTRFDEVAINGRVLLFAITAASATGLVAALLPIAGLLRADAGTGIQPYTRSRGSGRPAVTSRLVVAEVAVATVLLVASSLLARDFVRVFSADLGFDPAGILTAELPSSHVERTGEQTLALANDVLQRTSALPDVANSAIVSVLPGGNTMAGMFAEVEGRLPGFVQMRHVSPHYFSMLSIPVVAGRSFTNADTPATPKVLMVNETFARLYFGGAAQAIGKRVLTGGGAWGSRETRSKAEFDKKSYTIVGVAGSIREHGVSRDAQPETYWAIGQLDVSQRFLSSMSMHVLIRARDGNAAGLAAPFRKLMRDLDPRQPVFSIQTLAHVMSTKLARERLLVTMMGAFAGTSLRLAAIGLYGVMAYAVALRRHEIAVRLALGGTPGGMLTLVMTRSATLVAHGVAVGVPVSLAWTWFSSSKVFAVAGTDPLVLALAAVLVVAGGLMASALPAWRAARVDPSVALRDE